MANKSVSVFDLAPVSKTSKPTTKGGRPVHEKTSVEAKVEEKLITLTEWNEQIAAAQKDLAERIQDLIPERIRKQIAEMNEEIGGKLAGAQEHVDELEEEIRAIAITIGHTVEGGEMQAVWSKGATRWNTELLEGFIAAQEPEMRAQLEAMRKVGDPLIRITAKRRKSK